MELSIADCDIHGCVSGGPECHLSTLELEACEVPVTIDDNGRPYLAPPEQWLFFNLVHAWPLSPRSWKFRSLAPTTRGRGAHIGHASHAQ